MLRRKDFFADADVQSIKEKKGQVTWQSPSNLAIVKYWGKYGEQLPSNPSLSITLSNSLTETQIDYHFDPKRQKNEIDFCFEGIRNKSFADRINKFINSLSSFFSFLTHSHFAINSRNTFPHSSGIASSASSMSALALCLCSIEKSIVDNNQVVVDRAYFLRKASFISRLGSGSACRSLYPSFALWGETNNYSHSSDLYAIEVADFHPVYSGIHDDILIVSELAKSVSSSVGHSLMEKNPYASQRFQQASDRIGRLKNVLINGDVGEFGKILESEALTLHAMMMASDPSYILMEPNTINVMNAIRSFRLDTGLPVFFSLDAGPNVHIISFSDNRAQVSNLLIDLKSFANRGAIIEDRIGEGPKLQ
jgi:diphosphomevalonate decarboxylase